MAELAQPRNPRIWISLFAQGAVLAMLLFGGAGTLRWPWAWAFLALFFGGAVLITQALARSDPALLAERARPPIQKGQPTWDRIIMAAFMALFLAWLALIGLDAVRFGWSVVPLGLRLLGAAGLLVFWWICHRTLQANTFLIPVVRIQSERGHRVVTTGPYAVVRHPLYAAALILFPSTALMLGSWAGMAGGVILAGLLVLRTALEDRELRRRLDGYSDYAERVRYRLVPLLW